MAVSVFFVVFAIGLLRRFLYPMLDPLAFVPFPKPFSIWPFPKPWFTHMLWFKLKPWFEQNQCFCFQTIFYTKSCFTQKLCYPQTQCFTQKQCSCWACAMALCSLQDSSFHGGRRNTPKAVKFAACWHVHAWNMKLCLSKVYEPKKLYFSDFCVLNVHLLRLAKRGKHAWSCLRPKLMQHLEYLRLLASTRGYGSRWTFRSVRAQSSCLLMMNATLTAAYRQPWGIFCIVRGFIPTKVHPCWCLFASQQGELVATLLYLQLQMISIDNDMLHLGDVCAAPQVTLCLQ